MFTLGVIPARYESTRFPGKPLALIAGQTLIERVWIQAKKCRRLDDVIIATDDKRILSHAKDLGAKAVMTSRSCSSGTDRIAEAVRIYGKKVDVVINIQGDEPLIAPKLIDALALELAKDSGIECVTAAYPLIKEQDILNPNIAKLVLDSNGCALYFSRSPIPFDREKCYNNYLKHIGIYGYRRKFLLEFSTWKQTPLEKSEMLEQLRILENGHNIKVVISPYDSFGVDLPQDVSKIEKILRGKK